MLRIPPEKNIIFNMENIYQLSELQQWVGDSDGLVGGTGWRNQS